MSETTRLKMPFIMGAQAQKHVTHNEALLAADTLVHLSVETRGLGEPPAVPIEGARYLVADSPSGAFLGQAGKIAAYDEGAWRFHAPRDGWRCWVADEALLIVRSADAWLPLGTAGMGSGALAEFGGLGIGTSPDATNRLAVKANAALFTHDDVTPGSGSMRVTLNKSMAARDAGLVFQTGFSSRALLGTFGSDAFTVKVSPDGSVFSPVLSADPAGKVALRGAVDAATTQPIQLNGQVLVSADRVTVEAASAVGVALQLSNTRTGAHGGYVLSASGAGTFTIADQANGSRLVIGASGNILPGLDNAVTLGEAGKRFSAVYAASGTIQTSDRRDKTDVVSVDAAFALALLDAIDPVTFRWRDVGDGTEEGGSKPDPVSPSHLHGRHAGFLAQDVRSALAAQKVELGVWGRDDPLDPASRQWLRPDQLLPLLWRALQETRREVQALKAGATALLASP